VTTHRGLAGRAITVIATAVFVLAVAPGTTAQDARDPIWWTKLPYPSAQIQAALLENVQGMPASSFDAKLPPIPIDAWLFATLAPRVEDLGPRLVEWRVEFCGGYARGANPSIVTATGPELCAKGAVRVSPERTVRIVILVADAVRGAWDRSL
jgi:hypothetical protein